MAEATNPDLPQRGGDLNGDSFFGHAAHSFRVFGGAHRSVELFLPPGRVDNDSNRSLECGMKRFGLLDQTENACPAVRVYAKTDKLLGSDNYLTMSVTQADRETCDPASVER